MTTRLRRGVVAAACATIACLAPRCTSAQSTNQLGAWDGLMVSPVGALAPIAHAPGEFVPGASEFSLRYGRWSYDADDAIHDNIGLTWTRAFSFARARVSITGMYEAVECPTCSGWASGDLMIESTLWQSAGTNSGRRRALTDVGLRLSLGGAKFLGAEASTAGSVAVTVPLNLAFPLWGSSSLAASLVPGYGFGHVTGADFGAGGFLPMLGAAISWSVTRRIGVDFGAQRIFIAGGPTQIGAALSYRIGPMRAVAP